jgi:hypothetical protein
MVWRIALATGPILSADDRSRSPVEIKGMSQRRDKILPNVLRPLPGEPSRIIPIIFAVKPKSAQNTNPDHHNRLTHALFEHYCPMDAERGKPHRSFSAVLSIG